MSDPNDIEEIVELMREALAKGRKYNDFFDWHDRWTKEEFVSATAFTYAKIEARSLTSRKNDDPPDCQALLAGKPVGIEVTEFIDRYGLEQFKKSGVDMGARWWDQVAFIEHLRKLISRKDASTIWKGGPYDWCFLIIYTDENSLPKEIVASYLEGFVAETQLFDRILFLMSYDPQLSGCPTFDLKVQKNNKK